MKFTVKITDVTESEIDIDAQDEAEAVEIANELFVTGELPDVERPWTHTTFKCGSAEADEWTQSLV